MCLTFEVEHPERVVTKGIEHGFEWLVYINLVGWHCGFIKVPSDHPWEGKGFEDLVGIKVHGGLTYLGRGVPCGKAEDLGYWIGFERLPIADVPEHLMAAMLPGLSEVRNAYLQAPRTSQDLNYTERECKSLCYQANKEMQKYRPINAPTVYQTPSGVLRRIKVN